MYANSSKKQSVKVIFSEALMVVAVIVTVIILALLVSGYWLNSNFEVERNGMLQISSLPTGADVEIDGESSSWLERTNSSKILSSGEHSVVLTKDGYDSWSKTINISEGLLYRLHYPRLFLNDRKVSEVLDIAKYTSATVPSHHNSILLMNDTTEWAYVNLDTDNPQPRTISIAGLFIETTSDSDENKNNAFTGKVLKADWDFDASHILFKVANGEAIEWVLLDVNNVEKSINLTKEFDATFSRVEILDNNSNTLLAVRNHNLHRIDIPGRLISAILVKNIEDFDHYHNEIVFSALKDDSADENDSSAAETTLLESEDDNQGDVALRYNIGYFKLGDSKPKILTHTATLAKVTISKFYDNKYLSIIEGQTVSVHQKDDFDEQIAKYELSFLPDKVEVGHDGEFLLFAKEHQLATLDMEAKRVMEWTIENDFDWIDNDMLYTVSDGELIVYDYDGFNRRVIAEGVSSRFPVVITSDKWLYYAKNSKLMREWLIPR